MGNLRPILIMGLLLLAYMMWVEWQKDYGPLPQAAAPAAQLPVHDSDVPAAAAPGAGQDAPAADLPVPLTPAAGTQDAVVGAHSGDCPIRGRVSRWMSVAVR